MKAKVTISRNSRDVVCITFRDEASGIQFAEASMTVEAYGYAITGLAEQDADLEVRGLEYVGKQRITESREIVCPIKTYDRKALSEWLSENAQEDGWLVSTYLGSQKSVTYKDDGAVLRYSVTRYVDLENAEKTR